MSLVVAVVAALAGPAAYAASVPFSSGGGGMGGVNPTAGPSTGGGMGGPGGRGGPPSGGKGRSPGAEGGAMTPPSGGPGGASSGPGVASGGPGGGSADGSARRGGGPGGGNSLSTEVDAWVKKHGTVVKASEYGGKTSSASSGTGNGANNSQTLYRLDAADIG
ncbi:hypothetical protein ABZ840_02725 [Streptomyces sp. NPDC047117]|uniref:hypothetical protein n=1 Tax=Streptomyces sp. NPDC047117 TaxID=3155379 RepID=UPI0034064BD2